MRVHIRMADDTYERSLSNIVSLFYDQPETTIGPEDAEGADMTIRVEAAVEPARIAARAALTTADGAEPIEADHVRLVSEGAAEDDVRKLRKQAVSHVLLDALQRKTGIVQQWGILTGVRPTKLLHDRYRRGEGRERTRRELRDDYLIADGKIALMERIVERQLAVLPDLYDLRREVSLYIGIPF